MTLSAVWLLLVPGLPWLLAIPHVRRRVPGSAFAFAALLPAIGALALPTDAVADPQWLLLGAGLGIDSVSRPLLALSILMWAVAALFDRVLLKRSNSRSPGAYAGTFYLLTLGGQLGAILAIDLVSFLVCSTLMGYGFFGILAQANAGAVQQASRVYLVCLIVADLMLFDAALIAATMSTDLRFEMVRQTIAQSSEPGLFIAMVLGGFALKAGVWPVHFWLPLALRAKGTAIALLLIGVPVLIGILGAWRWLPLGQVSLPTLSLIVQALGGAGVVYAVLMVLKRASSQDVSAFAIIAASGIFTAGVGAGLKNPAAWSRVMNSGYSIVVGLLMALVVLVAVAWHFKAEAPSEAANESRPWIDRWPEALIDLGQRFGLQVLPSWRSAWRERLESLDPADRCNLILKFAERWLQGWSTAITLVFLIGIVVAVVSAL